jgi:hypothetical protein
VRGEQAEVRRFAEIIQEAVNVLGAAKVTIAGPDPSGLYGLSVNRDEGVRQGSLVVTVRMRLRPVLEFDEMSLQTVEYMHTLAKTTWEDSREILSYHWRDGGIPHVHVGGGKEHIETGRVTVEALIRYCVNEAGWVPVIRDWERVLDMTSGHYEVNHRWT